MASSYEETYRLEKPQIRMFLESDKGKCVVKSLQDQEGCIIEVKLSEPDISTPLNLSFLKQQIPEVADDVIVSSIGPNVDMLTGLLSRCIFKAAGKEIGEECRNKCPAGLGVAEIVETSGGRLKCKAIYHCCLPRWKSKMFRSDEVLRQVVTECISKASNQGYKSIAFPALGSGNLGYPKYVTAAAIIDTVRELDNVPLSLVDVHVVGLPEDLDFKEAYTRHLHKVEASEDNSSEIITIGEMSLDLLEGEITDYCSDVIVHPTTKQLSFDSGDVSSSLRLKCGTSFVEECQHEESAMKENGVVLTGAPGLQCEKILHTAPKHFGSWKKTVKECVKYVDAMVEYTTIAFPAVPPDMQRRSLEEGLKKAAWEMVGAVMTLKTTAVERIRVFCPDQSKLATYKDAVFRAIPDLSTEAGRLKSRMRALIRNTSKTEMPADGMLETPGCSVMTKTEDLVAFAEKESVVVNIVHGSGEVHLKGPCHRLTKVCHHLDETLQTVADFGFVAYPICWESVESDQRVFNVAEGSIEYMRVKNSFMTALGGKGKRVTISKIERIQIPHLYRQYQIEMQTVQKEHPSKDNERIMWHGTDVEAVPNINKYGFNRSYSGKNATLFGQGVYFAVVASISSMDKYSPQDTSGNKYVYRARVLTGRYTKGDATMRDAPRVYRTGSVRYTSTTNDTSRPSLFCIYRDTHSYPEYLISFQLSMPQTS